MINDIHYSRAVEMRLLPCFQQADYDALPCVLDSLSNAQFRTAGYIIGERLMKDLSPAAFWKVFSVLVRYNSRAFLVTMLKALIQRLPSGDLTLHDDAFLGIVDGMSAIDRQKTLQNILPVLDDINQINFLFQTIGIQESSERIPYLLKVNTLPCAFLLFSSLRYVEHDRDLLIRIARFLIKQADTLSFNLASLIKVYFGLDEVKNTFSLQIKPFQLARIEQSYDAFCQVMRF